MNKINTLQNKNKNTKDIKTEGIDCQCKGANFLATESHWNLFQMNSKTTSKQKLIAKNF